MDFLREGTVYEAQANTMRQLRARMLALAERKSTIQYVKVPTAMSGMA